MPQVGGWRSEAAYDYVSERNPDYKRDYRAAVEGAAGEAEGPLMLRWGLRFPFRSSATGK